MCKEYTAPRETEDSEPYASIDANQEFGPVLNIGIATVIDVPGIEVQVPSLSSPGYSVWILISRGHERFVNEIHRHNSDIVNYGSSLRTKEENLNNVCFESSKNAVENYVQGSQDSNSVKTNVESSSVHRETVASTIRVVPVSRMSEMQKGIPLKLAFPSASRIFFDTMIKMHEKQMERCTGTFLPPVLKGRFQKQLERTFSDEDWLRRFYLGSFKTRFEICKDENGELGHIRAIQGHSGGMILSPRLMNYVLIPYKWKRFIYHVGRARDQDCIAEAGLVAGGKE